MQDKSCVPFGFLCQPFAELSQHEVNFQVPDVPFCTVGAEGPFRCSRCRGYVNPSMKFTDNGSKAVCNLCDFVNEVPLDYACGLNEFGERRDKGQKPEL